MIRVMSRRSSDNAGAYARLELPTTYGSGQYFVTLGWRPSGATVAFARLFDEKQKTIFVPDDENHEDPVIFVGWWDSYNLEYGNPFTATGFWACYRNIPQLDGDTNNLGLDFNYRAMP